MITYEQQCAFTTDSRHVRWVRLMGAFDSWFSCVSSEPISASRRFAGCKLGFRLFKLPTHHYRREDQIARIRSGWDRADRIHQSKPSFVPIGPDSNEWSDIKVCTFCMPDFELVILIQYITRLVRYTSGKKLCARESLSHMLTSSCKSVQSKIQDSQAGLHGR